MAVILLAIAAVAALATNPSDPEWPEVFTSTFSESTTYPVIGTHSTTGTFYYDFTEMKYRVDRANGRYDRYCGINGIKAFEDTPCSHIVVDGNRYIYYPDKDECCFCCSAAHGCGLVKPTWLEGAEFLGTTTFNGQDAYEWNKKGLQSNLYYETIAEQPLDRVMIDLNQKPDDDMQFHGRETSVPSGIFDLPSICTLKNTCSFLSACHAVQAFN